MSADFALPEIAEADATGDIAAFYGQIRADTGSALVNYVWRHLATVDGAAPWLWQVTRANDHGALAGLIGGIADASARAIAVRTRPAAPPAMGEMARKIVATYNSNNVGNLARVMLMLEALRRPADGAEGFRPIQAEPAPPVSAAETLPPLPRFADLSEEDLAAILVISEAGPAADSGIVPSLWRHLAIEPGLIMRLRDPLAAMLAAPAFASAFDDLRGRGLALAASTPLTLPPPVPFDRAAATVGLSRFSRRIAELLVAGRVLAEWTHAPADLSSASQETRP